MSTKTHDSTIQKIIDLAQTFPSLRDHQAVLDWDVNALMEWAKVASHGEALAVRFILRVWNQFEEWDCGGFDVFEALGTWDAEHWAAFRAWANNPITL